MNKLECSLNGLKEQERFSRRFKNGVEILEHETINIVRVDSDSEGDTKTEPRPRLVVGDAPSKSKQFISKSRSQLGEIDTYLRSIIRRPLNVK